MSDTHFINLTSNNECSFLASETAAICERDDQNNTGTNPRALSTVVNGVNDVRLPVLPASAAHSFKKTKFVTCPSGHFTHTYYAVDDDSDCCARDHKPCDLPFTSLPPMFPCRSRDQRVPYLLVCDSKADCSDASDEEFRVFQPCTFKQSDCRNGQVRLKVILLADSIRSWLLS
jgi:hypothetical protein